MKTIAIVSLLFFSVSASTASADEKITKIPNVDSVHYAINKSNPPSVTVFAKGTVNTSGWTNGQLAPYHYVTPPADGIQDFDFFALAPSGNVLQVLESLSAQITGPIAPWLKGIRVHGAENSVEIAFPENLEEDNEAEGRVEFMADGGDTLPWPWSQRIESLTTATSQDGAVCGGIAGIVCRANQFCDYPQTASCGIADQTGECRDRPEVCTMQYVPVCGCDGNTYSNACHANAAGVSVQSAGECS